MLQIYLRSAQHKNASSQTWTANHVTYISDIWVRIRCGQLCATRRVGADWRLPK